ncbi:MAG: ferredoxin-type protein NapG [Candidatus Competibacteraceae bacterium]|jgi:ferredoxin-type protein NapG|nr:ferredoxin-type protein NapG [Candidatus Competibacteraceae bacterium]
MKSHNPARRQFFTKLGQGSALAATGGLLWAYLLQQQAQATSYALRPPGARDDDDFNALCIKCGQCVQACPFDTLDLAAAGTAVPIGTPYFTPREIPCYMCPDIPCQQACPTGALNPGLEKIDDARMGLAVIDPENCLSWQGLRCEICHRECPVQGAAISIEHHPRQLSKHALFVPVVHSDHCTGCGVCEQACPTQEAAIKVVPPELVQGKMGEHYRLGWTVETPITEHFTPPADVPQGTTPPAEAPGLDYLNEDGL